PWLPGGSSDARRSCLYGSIVMTAGTRMTTSATATTNTSIAMPVRSCCSLRQARAYGPGLEGILGMGRLAPWSDETIGSRLRLGGTDPGVDEAIRNVHEQICHDITRRGEKDDALDHWIVLREDRVDGQLSDPLSREDGLDDDAAGDELSELEPDDGDDRDERVAHRVPADDQPERQPLRTGGSDVLAAEHLEQRRTCQARDEAGRVIAEDERRHDEPIQPARAPRWEQAEADREQQDEEHREEEAGRRYAAQRDEHHDAVEGRVALDRGEDPETDPEHDGEHERREGELDRAWQSF